jgi:hypothetical protein
MSQTLATTITNVRTLLDEPNAQFWSDAQLTNYINEGCSDVARRTEWKRTNQSIAINKDVQTYMMPPDLYRAYRVEYIQSQGNSNNTYTVEFRGYMEMDQVWGINQNWPANYPLYYTLWGAPPLMKILLYPVPNGDGTLIVYYYQTTTPAVNDTDEIDMLQGWEDTIEDYACYRALRQDAQPAWKDFKGTYEEKLQFFTDSTRTFQDQAGTFSTGQAALPAWLTSEGY